MLQGEKCISCIPMICIWEVIAAQTGTDYICGCISNAMISICSVLKKKTMYFQNSLS